MRIDLKMDKEIGKGSFGKVSIARWRGLTVAVKELKGNSEIGFHTTTPEILKNLQKANALQCLQLLCTRPRFWSKADACLSCPSTSLHLFLDSFCPP